MASYPKSGNTWLRIVLDNYLNDKDTPGDINRIGGSWSAAYRAMFDETLGIETSDLTQNEIDYCRPIVYRHLAEKSDQTLFFKIHDALSNPASNCRIVPEDATHGIIYLIRNPLDVAVSYAYFMKQPIDTAIGVMGTSDAVLCRQENGAPQLQLPQRLSTWSGHVLSWTEATDLRVHVMRYEDMQKNPVGAFGDAFRFVGLPDDADRLQRAVDLATFERLSSQEQAHGFREKPWPLEAFFRKGEIGDWRNRLTEKQTARIVDDHRTVMKRFGYLDEKGRITV